jgi:hypothetical protein
MRLATHPKGIPFVFGNIVAQLSELNSKTTQLGELSNNTPKTISVPHPNPAFR